ncbi:MAG: multicopper oxidase CueO [Acetobacteraceae bacterium]|nr:multicopper oxidase CueO [Acetobacteraceae bacterium]
MVQFSRRAVLLAGASACAPTAFGPIRRARAANGARPSLPIPPELRADASHAIALHARPGSMRFYGAAGPATATYGINGAYLGPAVRVRRGETVVAQVSNSVPEDITMHWHGLIIPGAADGGPYQVIPFGKRWQTELLVDQPAATLWFHPHLYPSTADLVIKGLAGLIIVDDDESGRLPLPSRWGVDDIPLIIQDRRFKSDGQFFARFNIVAVTNGYVGDTALVNGALYPEAGPARGWIRLRILNGSNARSYALAASDRRSLYVIASDGGLLESPVELKELLIHAGERFEVLVDGRNGNAFDLVTLPVSQPIMRLPPFDGPLPLVTFRPESADGKGQLPDSLAVLPSLPEQLPPVSQELVMNMFRDQQGMMALKKAGLMAMAQSGKTDPAVVARVVDLIVNGSALAQSDQLSSNGVNGAPFALGEKGFGAVPNQDLLWQISEGSDQMLHPVHIHGCQFRIVSQNGKPPEPQRAGWKDVAPISAGGVTEILVRFPHSASRNDPYMAHCHILEHEDSGMMTQFTVA